MKKLVVLAAIVFAPLAANAADGFSTVDEFQPDFDKAKPCKEIDGRKVWKGEKAFYIQAYAFSTGQSKALSDDAASTVVKSDQSKDVIDLYERACR
ncbi:hypothetical protein [Agrobacterium sp. 10MFCol1.1]|uniref:hypothetical protein n=1 Tax=Agrobacterium sp. 10MFCol1.1 TaxID=1150775 RepID=UPI00037604EB|nr:hypothetical protein [Agrobacterium sp. 10MFCol1.1]